MKKVPWAALLVGWIGTFAVGMLMAWGIRVAGWWEGGAWELAVMHAVNDTVGPVLDAVMLTLPFVGTNYTLAPMIAVAAFVLWRRGHSLMALHLVVVQAGSWLINPALKFATARPRPELFEARGQHAFPAFPSGHLIAVVAVLGTVAWLMHRHGKGSWATWAVVVFTVIVGYSRVYLGVHWPTDVLGGMVVGGLWLWWTLRLFAPRYARSQI